MKYEVFKSNLCNLNDAYILVKDKITIAGRNLAIEAAFKNCTPFIRCITNIDGTTADDAEGLDLVISMCKLIEYSLNYFCTTDSLLFYSKD